MARPVKQRRVCQIPQTAEFVPCGRRLCETVELRVEEYEVIRLIDLLDMTQEECAAQMNVARTTVQAIYDAARKKLADILVGGKRLVISGGSYAVCRHSETCCGKGCSNRLCRASCCKAGEGQCACRPK